VTSTKRVFQGAATSPVLWGIAASVGFFGLIHGGILGHDFFQRYCAGHPVEYVETGLFFIGLSLLVAKALDVAGQFHALGQPLLGPIPAAGQTPADCEALLGRLDRLPPRRRGHCLVRRVREALEHVWRRDSAHGLEEHLNHLADLEADRVHASYALLRLIVWAIPILGFLGTVIGITMAIASLKPEALEQSMNEVTAGLGVAFDTTALALALCIILMFVQHYVDRAEGALLERVSQRSEAELFGRFAQEPEDGENEPDAPARPEDGMLQAVEQLVHRQAELWQESIQAAQQRWSRMADSAGKHLQAALAEGLKQHARELAAAEQAAADDNRRQWGELQQALAESVQAAAAAQEALVERVEVLSKAVEATSHIARLEEALNRNLAALAGSKNFEETVMSLAAAIHLLNARLAERPAGAAIVHLEPTRRLEKAA